MSVMYTKADQETLEMISEVMNQYHGGLRDSEVTVQCLMASAAVDANGDSLGHAIMAGGYPALATVRIIPIKQRAAGFADAEIILDADNWEVSSERERRALIDHELHHLMLKVDEKGHAIRDDQGRPKFTMRKHDIQVGWFNLIANRHGEASVEVRQFREMMDSSEFKQCYFAGMEPVY